MSQSQIHFHIDETAGFALLSNVMLNYLKRSGWGGNEIEGRQHEFYLSVCQSVCEARSEIESEINSFVKRCGFDEQALQAVVSGVYAIRGFDLAQKLTQQRQALCN